MNASEKNVVQFFSNFTSRPRDINDAREKKNSRKTFLSLSFSVSAFPLIITVVVVVGSLARLITTYNKTRVTPGGSRGRGEEGGGERKSDQVQVDRESPGQRDARGCATPRPRLARNVVSQINPCIYEPSERSGQCRRASSWRSVPNYAPSWYTLLALPHVISLACLLLVGARRYFRHRRANLSLAFSPSLSPSLYLPSSLALSLFTARESNKNKREKCAIVEFHSRAPTLEEAPTNKALCRYLDVRLRDTSRRRSAGRRHTRNGDGAAHGAREHT